MKKKLCFLITICLLLVLVGCKEEHPQYTDDLPQPGPIPNATGDSITPEPLPAVVNPEEEGGGYAKRPLTPEEVGIEVFTTMVNDFEMAILMNGVPDIELNSEDTLNGLRDWISEINEHTSMFQLDRSDIYMYDYGYRLKVDVPADYWGNHIYYWLDKLPDSQRIVAVSPGKDGKLTYAGYGADYSQGGFGDDDVRLLQSW